MALQEAHQLGSIRRWTLPDLRHLHPDLALGRPHPAWFVAIAIASMFLARLAALIMIPTQIIGHFLFYNFLHQSLHSQLQNGTGKIPFAFQTTVEHLRDPMAYFLTWWYPLHGVRFPFFAKIGFLAKTLFYLTPLSFYRIILTLPRAKEPIKIFFLFKERTI
jgi:hypothetical protein